MKLRFWRKKDAGQTAQAVDQGVWTHIFEWTKGAWQSHSSYDQNESVLSYPTIFSCQTTIANDIAKLKPITQQRKGRVWEEVDNTAITGLLLKPNDYQNYIQFQEAWITSKLLTGNVYCLKVREPGSDKVAELHVLDPYKVEPLVADNGDVYYRLKQNNLNKVFEEELTLPATEIIHDRFNCIFHPLVGLSPLFAAAISAQTGQSSQKNIKSFLRNGSNPGGILSAPGAISDTTAQRLKEKFEAGFTGENSGKVAVAGDDLKFIPIRMSNVDAQVIELMGWNDERICSVYHVPGYMVGVGEMPKFDNIEALVRSYYSQCLQVLIEAMESSLDAGLKLGNGMRVQLDVEAGLFRMDSATLITTLSEGTKSGLYAPNEAREKLNLPPVDGGESPYMQQQNYSLAALANRDLAEESEDAVPETEEEMGVALAMFDMLTKNAKVA